MEKALGIVLGVAELQAVGELRRLRVENEQQRLLIDALNVQTALHRIHRRVVAKVPAQWEHVSVTCSAPQDDVWATIFMDKCDNRGCYVIVHGEELDFEQYSLYGEELEQCLQRYPWISPRVEGLDKAERIFAVDEHMYSEFDDIDDPPNTLEVELEGPAEEDASCWHC